MYIHMYIFVCSNLVVVISLEQLCVGKFISYFYFLFFNAVDN